MAFTRLNIAALKRQVPKVARAPAQHLDARTKAEAIAEAAAEAAQERRRDSSPREYGGPKGLEPTRYGDWEKAGRCFDF